MWERGRSLAAAHVRGHSHTIGRTRYCRKGQLPRDRDRDPGCAQATTGMALHKGISTKQQGLCCGGRGRRRIDTAFLQIGSLADRGLSRTSDLEMLHGPQCRVRRERDRTAVILLLACRCARTGA